MESSRGRSRMKTNVERSVSTSNKKSPIKVDVMDPFFGGNHLGSGGRMPARQKSMIDLREPAWGDMGAPGVGPHLHPQHHPIGPPHGRNHHIHMMHGKFYSKAFRLKSD